MKKYETLFCTVEIFPILFIQVNTITVYFFSEVVYIHIIHIEKMFYRNRKKFFRTKIVSQIMQSTQRNIHKILII